MSLPAVLLAGLLLMSLASAADAAQRHRLNLPGGRLGDALVALGRQTGISVGVTDPALANERVPAISGTLTLAEALRRLLRGHNAGHTMIDSRTIRVVRVVRPVRPRPVPVARAPAPRPAPVAVRPRPAPPSPQDREVAAEIVVTASRRSLPLRSYPASATIVDGDDPALGGTRGTDALVSRLPALGSTHLGPGRNKLFVRGISDSSFNGPTQATVGQYLGEARVNYSAPDPDLRLHDVERIEVLAGPQGTLHGAGSLGGIIRIVPNAPRVDRLEGNLSIAGTSTRHGDRGGDASAVLNVPLGEGKFGLRLSGYAVSEGGYIDDIQRGLKDINRVRIAGGRAALRHLPDDHWTLDLAMAGQRIRGADAQFADPVEERLTRRSNISQGFENDYLLGSIVAAREWEDFRFVASSALVRQKLSETFDTTRVENQPAAYHVTSKGSLLVAEARVAKGQVGGSGWLAGATILSNRARQDREVRWMQSRFLRNSVENDIIEAALYGEGTAALSSAVNVTLGGRVSTARLRSSGFNQRFGTPLNERFREAGGGDTKFLPAAAISAQANPDLLLYARYQQSFRPGGLSISGDDFTRFRPDKISSYETGVRYGLPGVRVVDLSAAIAYTNWSDIQADTIDNFAETTTINLGDARIYTLDVSLGYRPFTGLALEAVAVFNDSVLSRLAPGADSTSYAPLPGVSRFNGRFAMHYSFGVGTGSEVRLHAAARYTGKSVLATEDLLRRPQGDWLDLSLLAQVNSGRHSLRLGVTNLFDTAASRFALGSPLLLNQNEYVTPIQPRIIRLGWEVRY